MNPYVVQKYKELLTNLETSLKNLEELHDNTAAFKRKLEVTSTLVPAAEDEVERYLQKVKVCEEEYPELLKIKSEVIKRL